MDDVNLVAAAGRIRRWLDLHPNTVNIAAEIGIDAGFISDGWSYRFYAIDRRDLEAVLAVIESKEY